MKLFKLFFVFIAVTLFSGCGTTSSSGFWGGASNFIDYSISQWETRIPSDSYDHTLIDAWKSGTGGKALVASDMAVSIVGGISNKDVSGIRNRIHNAALNLTQNDTFNSSDVNNWVGAMFTLGDELIDESKEQKFEKVVAKLTDPSFPGYNEEEALRVDYIDYDNRKIIWKSNSRYIYDLMEYRKTKNDNWISSNLEPICGMSIEEYNNLSKEKRQNIDLKILIYEKSKDKNDNTPQSDTLIIEPTIPDLKNQIEKILISNYDINAYKLSEEQKNILNRIAEMLRVDNSILIQISGHTCSLGSEKINYAIGLKRATEAKNYLVSLGIDINRIEIESEGFSHPITDNSTEEERKHNRRITFNIK
ncbi:MAG: OmpA family protein [Prevotella sp.]|nr:OmpA family protein [Prevotella sp.]